MADVEDVFHQKGAELSDVVRPIREVNRKHQQVCVCVCVCVYMQSTELSLKLWPREDYPSVCLCRIYFVLTPL